MLNLLLSCLAAAQEPLDVVATIPDIAALTREIGGGAVAVETLVRPGEDPHYVLAKASQVLKLQRADALILMGLGYEHAFLPALVEKCRNGAVKPGGSGYLNLGQFIQPLEVPQSLDRGQGADLHPLGNPHYNLDPENARIMARNIAEFLARLDPARAADYRARHADWDQRAQAKIAEWAQLMAPRRGTALVEYHRSWIYLARHYGLRIVGDVEPKPGLPPSAKHLAGLAETMRAQSVRVILIEPWFNENSLGNLVELTGAKLLRMPVTCGGTPETETYLGYMDTLVQQLAAALAP